MSFHKIAYFLVFVGALNWGLVGLFGFNIVTVLFGYSPTLENLVYVLIGFCALVDMKNHIYCCSECAGDMGTMSKMGKKKKK